MAVCERCGKSFAGFSFGSNAPTKCRDCRKLDAAGSEQAQPQTPSATIAPLRPGFQPTVTLVIIALNLAVYVAMGLTGVSWTEPSITDAVKWGADFGPLTLSGQWWRLFTSTFVHFGIIHIGFNMYCFWDLGRGLEYFMGRRAFVVAYLVSGLGASLVSVGWNPWRVSAGASGAIFGVAGAFFAYLAFKKTPYGGVFLKQRIKSLAIFIAYNLFRGLAGGVDNSAHMGGLVFGFVLGALIPAVVTYREVGDAGQPSDAPSPPESAVEREARVNRIALQAGLASLAVLVICASLLHHFRAPEAHYGRGVRFSAAGDREASIAEMKNATSGDGSVLALSAIGQEYLEEGDPADAIEPLKQAIKLDSEWPEAKHNLALAYLGAGQPNLASVEILDVLHEEKKEDWRARFILAAAYEAAGDRRAAFESFGLVVSAQPEFQEAKSALAAMQASPANRTAIAIPYSKLIAKSDYWPLFP